MGYSQSLGPLVLLLLVRLRLSAVAEIARPEPAGVEKALWSRDAYRPGTLRFQGAAHYDSELVMEVDMQLEGDRRFRVSYHLAVDGKVIGIGHEVRAWATVDAKGDLTRLQSTRHSSTGYAVKAPARRPAAGVMVLPMGRRDIADYLGITLETVSRALSEFQRKGYLRFLDPKQRQIVELNAAGLTEVDPET